MSDARSRHKAALDGRYRIKRELGRGGTASVYLTGDIKNIDGKPQAQRLHQLEAAFVHPVGHDCLGRAYYDQRADPEWRTLASQTSQTSADLRFFHF